MKSVKKKYFPVVISAPSGGGKSTVKNHLVKKDKRFAFSVTCTTREKRPGEKEGRDYYFVDAAEFDRLRKMGELIEWAEVHGRLYGTPKRSVISILERGKIPFMTIDVKGARSVKKIFADSVSVFLLPPDLRTMIKRLEKRGERPAEMKVRMNTARKELGEALRFDYLVINDRLEDAVNDIIGIANAEKCRLARNGAFAKDFKGQLSSLKI
ncbi:MAG: guanylate kinase [Elusimicrobia bacterium CG08_land_8_20_14_0_20_51_18]|nr:MAG: guanylate kinase [Elusimicrobia bacterium CG08_land_8_20_14_0_20_51_18]